MLPFRLDRDVDLDLDFLKSFDFFGEVVTWKVGTDNQRLSRKPYSCVIVCAPMWDYQIDPTE